MSNRNRSIPIVEDCLGSDKAREPKKKHDIAAEIAAVGRPHQLETEK